MPFTARTAFTHPPQASFSPAHPEPEDRLYAQWTRPFLSHPPAPGASRRALFPSHPPAPGAPRRAPFPKQALLQGKGRRLGASDAGG